MSIADQLQKYLTQTCTVTTFSSKDEKGQRTVSGAVTYPCRQEVKHHLVLNAQGQEVVARTTVYVGESSTGGLPTTMTPDDLFTDPDSNTPPVIAIDAHPSDSIAQHVTVHLG